jgi:hypothetical protein
LTVGHVADDLHARGQRLTTEGGETSLYHGEGGSKQTRQRRSYSVPPLPARPLKYGQTATGLVHVIIFVRLPRGVAAKFLLHHCEK